MSVILPSISIITPNYNQGQYLRQTIQSVVSQRYPHLEYFVMDGGSHDNSVQIIQYYTDHLTGWVSQKDRGQADAINQGFARSTGDVLGWLNSDDILWSGALQAVGRYFAEHPEVDVVMGWCLFFHGTKIRYLHDPIGLTLEYLLYSRYFLPQDSIFWRRRVYEQIGELDLNYYMLDHDYFIRMAKSGARAAIVRRPIGGFRQHDGQKTAHHDKVEKSQRQIQAHHRTTLGLTPAQCHWRQAYWQRRLIATRAVRKLWRITIERMAVRQAIEEGENYLRKLEVRSE